MQIGEKRLTKIQKNGRDRIAHYLEKVLKAPYHDCHLIQIDLSIQKVL